MKNPRLIKTFFRVPGYGEARHGLAVFNAEIIDHSSADAGDGRVFSENDKTVISSELTLKLK